MINYAHRGASEYAPENTMAAFCLGIEMGANGIETDVQRTKDGVLLLCHDATFQRTAGVDRPVCDMTWAEVSRLDVGSFKGDRYRAERVVPLADFVRLLRRKAALLRRGDQAGRHRTGGAGAAARRHPL